MLLPKSSTDSANCEEQRGARLTETQARTPQVFVQHRCQGMAVVKKSVETRETLGLWGKTGGRCSHVDGTLRIVNRENLLSSRIRRGAAISSTQY